MTNRKSNTRVQVLMLGWEYPPILNGGLGIACYGLCNQLKNLAQLTLILPKTDPDYICDNINIIGLSATNFSKHFRETSEYTSISGDVNFIDSGLLPYPVSYKSSKKEGFMVQDENGQTANLQINPNKFQQHLYSAGIYDHVKYFSYEVEKITANKSFSVIHAHDWMTFPAAMKIKEKSGKPLVLHVHSLETDRIKGKQKGIPFEIEKKAMNCADAIVSVSDWTKKNIVDEYDIPGNKIHTVHNGIDKILDLPLKISKPYKIVLFLGRLTYQKGPEKFLKIARQVLKAIPDTHFVMAGAGDQLSDLITESARLKISNRIHFTGFLDREKVARLLSMTDVYVMPSVSEPFGLSALEAAQNEIPCIISRQSGVSEVLRHALKADFWDVDKLANYIISILDNKELRKELTENARRDVENVDWERAAKKVSAIYDKLINN